MGRLGSRRAFTDYCKDLLVRLVKQWRKTPIAFLLPLFSMVVLVKAAQQELVTEPSDLAAIIGSTVTFPCRVRNRAGPVQWSKDAFAMGEGRELPGYPRYHVIGSDDEGEFTLEIERVIIDDEGAFRCQVGTLDPWQEVLWSRIARLTVLIPSLPPIINQGRFFSVIEDRIVVLECLAKGGKPKADITWYDYRRKVIRTGVNYTSQPDPIEPYRINVGSTLRFIPKKENHNQTFYCRSQNIAEIGYQEAKITVAVYYAPKVQLKINSGNNWHVPEGEDVAIACLAEARPNNMTFKWSINDEVLPNETGMELKIPSVTRKLNEVDIKCEVQNEIGKSEETKNLVVTYPPKFRSLPKDIETEVGTVVTLSCDADGSPKPKISWYHHEEDQQMLVGKTANLTITTDTHTTGLYVCRVEVEGFDEIEAEVALLVKGPPLIISKPTQYGSKGESVSIDCFFKSIPKVERIVWTFNGKEIDTHLDKDYIANEDMQPLGVMNSTLTILNAQKKHFGTYKCSVTNSYGTDAVEITLTYPSALSPFIILIGAASGLLLATIIILIVICQRKHTNTKPREDIARPDVTVTATSATTSDDTAIEIFQENDGSTLNMGLRQRNGNCVASCINAGSSSTLSSSARFGSGAPLTGSIPLSTMGRGSSRHPNRYSSDYGDPAYDGYKGYGGSGYSTYVHYGQEYTPGSLRVQIPTFGDECQIPNKVLSRVPQHSEESIVQIHPTIESPNNPFKIQGNPQDFNSLGLPQVNEALRHLNGRVMKGGVDMQDAATHKSPPPRNHKGYNIINTSKPSVNPAPPPYPSMRSPEILASGSYHSVVSPTNVVATHGHGGRTPNATSSRLADDACINIGNVTPRSPNTQYITMTASHRIPTHAIVTRKGNGAMVSHV